jgi:hypothetical protein
MKIVCEYCGKELYGEEAELTEDRFMSEILDDHTLLHLCYDCNEEHAQDI